MIYSRQSNQSVLIYLLKICKRRKINIWSIFPAEEIGMVLGDLLVFQITWGGFLKMKNKSSKINHQTALFANKLVNPVYVCRVRE